MRKAPKIEHIGVWAGPGILALVDGRWTLPPPGGPPRPDLTRDSSSRDGRALHCDPVGHRGERHSHPHHRAALAILP